MEGRASNFNKVLADFQSRLQGAEFVAIDTELTGVELNGEPDTFGDSAATRVNRICRIAEKFSLIQIGITIVGRASDGVEGHLSCTSYNLFAFPYVGADIPDREPGFYCQGSALQFNAKHRVDFNVWINEGIPYMSREEERRYLASKGKQVNSVDEKVGLLRLWKALCLARIPFVVHTPLDLFFLLAAFERRPLPRDDPRAIAMLIRQVTPRIYDTAYLHGACDRFRQLGLTKYFQETQARYDALYAQGKGLTVVPDIRFFLQGATASRYGKNKPLDELAHEAGYDSLITAQIFAYLRAIAPAQVKEATNRLFLYKSAEYLDLDGALRDGTVGKCMFDLSRVTLLVAELDPAEGLDAPRQISAAGYTYKWMDHTHLLVVMRASGGAAVRKAGELAAKVRGVAQWLDYNDWHAMQMPTVHKHTNGHADKAQNGNAEDNHKLWEKALREPERETATPSETPEVASNANVDANTDTKWMFCLQVLLAASAGLLLLQVGGRGVVGGRGRKVQ
jgi:hypothetical protein